MKVSFFFFFYRLLDWMPYDTALLLLWEGLIDDRKQKKALPRNEARFRWNIRVSCCARDEGLKSQYLMQYITKTVYFLLLKLTRLVPS